MISPSLRCLRLLLCLSAVTLVALHSAAAQTPPASAPALPSAPLLPSALSAEIDPAIARVIFTTAAIDNHAHTVLPPPADATDRDFDALPVDNMEADTDPIAWRPDHPQLPAAWHALWKFDGAAPLDAAGLKQLQAARAAVKQREGTDYTAYVLQLAGVDTQLSNRVSMGPGLPLAAAGLQASGPAPRFGWVPYADALLFPLNNRGLATANPDRAAFFPLEDRLRARYLQDAGLAAMPATLDGYLRLLVTATLEKQRAAGAIAEKFEVAYLRPFGFTDLPQAEAASIYARWIGQTAAPDPAEYTALQNFLFRYIAMECGRLGMPVHVHSFAGGGGYFDIAGGNPLRLEPLLNDPRLRRTRFVLLHAGWPFVRETTALLQKPNVWLDISQESLRFSPRIEAAWLRERLESYPDKVLFGTDGYPYSDSMGWEESTWIAAHNARTALGLALTGMLHDGVVGQARAEELARMVLRDNALALYGKS